MSRPRSLRVAVRRGAVGVLVLVVTTFLVLLLAGAEFVTAGPVLRLTDTHGIHLSDLPLVVLWAIALAGAAYLWRDAGE